MSSNIYFFTLALEAIRVINILWNIKLIMQLQGPSQKHKKPLNSWHNLWHTEAVSQCMITPPHRLWHSPKCLSPPLGLVYNTNFLAELQCTHTEAPCSSRRLLSASSYTTSAKHSKASATIQTHAQVDIPQILLVAVVPSAQPSPLDALHTLTAQLLKQPEVCRCICLVTAATFYHQNFWMLS